MSYLWLAGPELRHNPNAHMPHSLWQITVMMMRKHPTSTILGYSLVPTDHDRTHVHTTAKLRPTS
jgi:hypothetical protein